MKNLKNDVKLCECGVPISPKQKVCHECENSQLRHQIYSLEMSLEDKSKKIKTLENLLCCVLESWELGFKPEEDNGLYIKAKNSLM
ncbi:hypothetical protein GW796_09130 [archaeon]|nr:hypothetical protein [archaeon]NCT58894.1 hypothetical protein [archaeon]